MDDIAVSNADRTRRFKTALHKAFPGRKFSVDRGGERVSWDEAGPTKTEVEEAILAAGVAEAKVAWNGERYLCVDGGQSVWLDRPDMAGRAAEVIAAQQRREEWLELYGSERTEIDALAALRPDELERIARDTIAPHFDAGVAERVLAARAVERARVIAEREKARAG